MNKKSVILVLIFCLLATPSLPAKANPANTNQGTTNYVLEPSQDTQVKLQNKTTDIYWFEDHLQIVTSYSLINPSDKKLKLQLSFPYNNNSLPEEYYPQVKVNKISEWTELSIDTEYKNGLYSWELSFDIEEEQLMSITYCLAREVNNLGLYMIDYSSGYSSKWAKLPNRTVVNLIFAENNPAQIREIEPLNYKFTGNQLSWIFYQNQQEAVLIKADTFSEKRHWETLVTQEERQRLAGFLADKDYLSAAELFRVKALAADKESWLQLQEVQGYYLIKAGLSKDALPIWQELYDNKSQSPRVYWELGQVLTNDENKKINNLYKRVRELQVHPLIQEWLAAMLQADQLIYEKPAKPLVEINNEGVQEGVLLEIHVTDPDGDLEKVLVNYHWEEQPNTENVIQLLPFNYEHTLKLFIAAPGPLTKLFYEVTAIDKRSQQTSTGEKEVFFLNNRLQGPVYSLSGAMLVLADYSPTEQDKVDKWFRSYLKLARDTGLVSLELNRPYFIFLGQNHEFIAQYQGRHFILYTPAPFNPELTRIKVHRFLLSYWFGPGWNQLPETELARLGDALLLSRGRYTLLCKYLSDKNDGKFTALLNHVGQNADFPRALNDIYGLTLAEAQIKALWHACNNMVIAVLLIILFTWLGKNGQITRIITYFMERKKAN
ncbi:MAG: hypothetical protein WAO24_06760 [Peptococcia bacterium]